MKFPAKAHNRSSNLLSSFYFHLEALETSIIHPKFLDDDLLSGLGLTHADVDYSFAVVEFIDHCASSKGAPTTENSRSVVLSTLKDLQSRIPLSVFDYRFCLYELDQLKSIAISMRTPAND